MKKILALVVIVGIQTAQLLAGGTKLTVKNQGDTDIECTLYMTGGLKDVKVKEVRAKKSEHFTVDSAKLEGFGWKTVSATNRNCKDWFKLSDKSEFIKTIIATQKDATLIIKDGGSIESSVGKEPMQAQKLEVFGQVCGNK
jgi:hypothetical protein